MTEEECKIKIPTLSVVFPQTKPKVCSHPGVQVGVTLLQAKKVVMIPQQKFG